MGRSRNRIINENQPYFLTMTVLHWIPVFTRKETVDIIFESFKILKTRNIKIHAYVILENHIHVIAQGYNLQKQLHNFKAYTAQKIIRLLKEQKIKRILDQLAFYKKAHKHDRAYQF